MKEIKTKCVITGHHLQELECRHDKNHSQALEIQKKLRSKIIELIEEGTMYFYCGMDLGVELWAGEILLDLKKDYPNIIVHSVLASEHRADNWSEEDRERYFDNVLPKCDEETYTSVENDEDCMRYHSNYLSRKADIYLAVWNGGEICDTAELIRKARKMKKVVVVIEVRG